MQLPAIPVRNAYCFKHMYFVHRRKMVNFVGLVLRILLLTPSKPRSFAAYYVRSLTGTVSDTGTSHERSRV